MSDNQWEPYETAPEAQPHPAAINDPQDPVPPTDPYDRSSEQAGRPRPHVSFSRAITLFFKNYAVFTGRASRSEFWWLVPFFILVGAILGGVNGVLGGTFSDPSTTYSVLSGVWSIGTIVPRLALCVRRLHDTNHSGFHLFWILLPLIGWIILIVFYLQAPRPDAWRRYDNGRLPAES